MNKVRKTIYKFYQLREFMSTNLLKMIYQALIQSVLNYGIRIWGSACSTALKHLVTTQKHILKIIFKKPKQYPTQNLFFDSQVSTIRELYSKSILKYMKNDERYRNQIQHNINTRAVTSENIFLTGVRFMACQRHIAFVGPRLFNLVPANIRAITSLVGYTLYRL